MGIEIILARRAVHLVPVQLNVRVATKIVEECDQALDLIGDFPGGDIATEDRWKVRKENRATVGHDAEIKHWPPPVLPWRQDDRDLR